MNILCVIVGMCILGICILVIESIRESKHFVVTRYYLDINKKNNKKSDKVVILSDLHNKVYGHNNSELIESIRKESPKMIWIAGDMLVGRVECTTDIVVSLMKELIEIAPIYYSNGNHEQRMKESKERYGDTYIDFKRDLIEIGVIFLENETTKVELAGEEISLSGIEIPFNFYERGLYDRLRVSDIENCIGEKNEGYQVLLAHNPVHCEGYAEWGADLVVSGHLHGGIIRLPFIGGVITPQVRLFPKYSGGCYCLNKTKIIVSKGLGEHTVKIRFLNRPELILLHVNK